MQSWKDKKPIVTPIRIFDKVLAEKNFLTTWMLKYIVFSVTMKSFLTLHESLSSIFQLFFRRTEQRWFIENQGWSALKQNWSALVLCVFSESVLNSAEKSQTFETALLSVDYLWDFNPGKLWYENFTNLLENSSIDKKCWLYSFLPFFMIGGKLIMYSFFLLSLANSWFMRHAFEKFENFSWPIHSKANEIIEFLKKVRK